jgi:hypothetical protein
MADYTQSVIKKLTEHNCLFIRHGKGDHNIWYSPITNNNFSIDGKIKLRVMANKAMKDAGITYKF